MSCWGIVGMRMFRGVWVVGVGFILGGGKEGWRGGDEVCR